MKLSKIYNENRLLILLVSILTILIGLPVIILIILNKTTSAVAWYDTSWQHRKTVTVSNDTGSTLTNEDVLVVIDTETLISESKLQTDCGDLRFVDSDDSTVLDYWIEGGCNTTTTEVWVQIPSLPDGGKAIYMYYANDTAANGSLTWSGNYIILSSQSSCPTGWSRVTSLDNTFPVGSDTYGGTAGNSTHTHTYTQIPSHTHGAGTLSTSPAGAHTHQMQDFNYLGGAITYPYLVSSSVGWYSGIVSTAGAHTHTITGSTGSTGIASETTSSTSNLPPYVNMLFCSPDSTSISVVPQSSIFLFESLPVSGYTRYSTLDNNFPRASSSAGGTGGSSTHTHTYTTVIAHTHGVGSLVTDSAGSHSHDVRYGDQVGSNPYLYTCSPTGNWGSGKISTSGAHTHTITGSTASTGIAIATTESSSNIPPYLDMIYASQDTNEESFLSGTISLTSSNPPLGWIRYSNLDNKYPKGATTSGGTGGNTVHNHIYNEVPTHTHTVGTLATQSAGAHSHNLLFTTGQVGGPDKRAYGQNSAGAWYTGALSTASDHTHTFSGTTASTGMSNPLTNAESNIPPYTEVIFSQRKGSQATVLGSEDSPVPNAPTAQPATAVSTTQITWNFTDNSTDELGFKVYDETDTLKVSCDTPDISSCSESGLSENTKYTRKFVAYNAFGDSQFSDTVSAYTKASNIDILSTESTVDTVTMTSSTFVNPTADSSGYYFDCTSGSCDTGINEWIQTNTDQATGLDNNTPYKFTVKNRNGDGVENSYPVMAIETWTKAAVPTISNTDITDTTITLEGIGVNYLAQGSSGLYFDCITEDSCDGGINEWVSTNTDTVVGLLPDTQYEFKVKARNYDGVETAYSTNTVSVYTDSTQPTISTVDNPTINTLDVTVDNHDNPTSTTYVVEEVNTAKYINSTGNLVVDPVWLTYDQLGSTSGLTVTGLDSNTEYTFRVKAKNQSDTETAYSDPVSAYTRLVAPTALAPTSKTDTTITWKLSTTETGYDGIKVYDNENNLTATCVGADITECEETGLTPNTQYGRKLTIYSTQSESAYSSLISERTYAQPVTISLTSSLNHYEVSLTIDLANNPVGTTLQILEENSSKYFDSNLGVLVDGEQEFESTSEPVIVSGLDPNTEYVFKVRAKDEDGNPTAWSAAADVRTFAQTPNIVSAIPLSTTSGRLTIDLKDNPINTRISILEEGGSYIDQSGVLTETEAIFIISGNSIDITGLEPNNIYTLRVRAYDEDNVTTDWSASLDLTTHIQEPTVQITGQTSNTVTLAISGLTNLDQGSSGVYVEDIGQWSQSATQVVTNLQPNRPYSFRVKARNSDGIETTYVESESVYTYAVAPTVQEGYPTSTTAGILKIDLGNNPAGTRISIMEVTTNKYLSTQGVLEDTEQILDTDNLQFTLKGLSANTTYSFKIKGYNVNSVPTQYSTEEYPITTLIEKPSISISNITNNSATIVLSGVSNISQEQGGVYVENIGEWSKSLSHNITGLNPNTSYTFRAKARNRKGVESIYVTSSEIQTLANIPTIDSVNKISSNSARVYIDTNNNPSNTQFAIMDKVSEQYVDANGNLQDSAVWLTYTQWGGSSGKYVTGLNDLRQVGFQVKARNSKNIETAFSEAQYVGTGSFIYNIPSTLSTKLSDNEDVDFSVEAQLGIKDIRVDRDEYRIVNLKVSFEQDRDWSDVVIDADFDNSKTVIKIGQEHGVTEPFTMYVVRNNTNAFRICPESRTLNEVKKGCTDEQLLTGNFPQEIEVGESIVTISEAKIDGVYYWIADGITGTGGMGESVEDTIIPTEEEQEETSFINRIVDSTNKISRDIVLGTTEIFDRTPIGNLNEEQLSNAVVTTTTVTVTIGAITAGITQSFYLIIHTINGILSAIGFRRKKKPFGYVYDSTTKQPISNAVVRIYKEKELVETSVTDSDGKFLSKLEGGKYRVEVKKGGYIFPSKLIKTSEDYPLQNIYKGGLIQKTDSEDLVVNIPIDKKELSTTAKSITILRNLSTLFLTIFNIFLFLFGILLLIYTYENYPELFRWYIPILYLPALYFLTRSIFSDRFLYGVVIGKGGNKLANQELYLINKEFDEVVAKRVTDENGRYRFIISDKGIYALRVGKNIVKDNIKIKRENSVLAEKIKIKRG